MSEAPADWKVYSSLAMAQFFWAFQQTMGKFSMNSGLPALVLSGMRSLGCIPVLGICAFLIDGKAAVMNVEPRHDFPWFFGLGLSGIVINHSLVALGVSLSSASEAVFMQPGIAVFTTLMSIMLKRESKSFLKLASIAAAVGGSILIVTASPAASASSTGASSSSSHFWGLMCFVGNTFFWSAFVIMQKPLLERFPALTLVFWTFLFGGFINIGIGLSYINQVPWTRIPTLAWIGVAYVILFGTVGAWLCNSYANKHLPPSITGIGICLQPLFGAITSSLLLGDHISLQHAGGGLVICVGVVGIVYARNQELRAEFERAATQPHPPIPVLPEDEAATDEDGVVVEMSSTQTTSKTSVSRTATAQPYQPIGNADVYGKSSNSNISSRPQPPSRSNSSSSTKPSLSRPTSSSAQRPISKPSSSTVLSTKAGVGLPPPTAPPAPPAEEEYLVMAADGQLRLMTLAPQMRFVLHSQRVQPSSASGI